MHLNRVVANFLKRAKKEADILSLRSRMAQAAQKVYDEWDQSDKEHGDPELGFGGICQDIAEEIAGVLDKHGIESGTVSQTQGDQHVYTIARVEEGVFEIDIHPSTYERGGGYYWTKIPDVKFSADDIAVSLIDTDPKKFEELMEDQC